MTQAATKTLLKEEPAANFTVDDILWKKVFYFFYLHVSAFYGLYLLTTTASWKTTIWSYVLLLCCVEGITVGTHRLWSHRAFKAKLPLRILLAFFQTLTFQKDVYDWVRDHRVHHKYADTNADPHNATRGFFFSHMGWMMIKKHKEVIEKGKALDMSDLEADPVVMIQRKYYWKVWAPLVTFLIPSIIPWYFWNEKYSVCWHACNMLRVCISLHGASSVNSAAHKWGTKPYDKNMRAVETTTVSLISLGEGFHNYHHTFPWDYKAAELGSYDLNWNTAFIDFMAKIGWAYDLKTATKEMVEKRAGRTGDGSRGEVVEEHGYGEVNVWGWGDKDMDREEMDMAKITCQEKST